MAVVPVNLARVSFNLRALNLQESLRLNQAGLYRVQNQLATGLRFLLPSQDPLRAASAIKLEGRLDRLAEVQNNLGRVNAVLTEVESAMQSAIDLVREAQALSVQAVDDGISSDERKALATVADSLLNQLLAVGNHRYLNTWLFCGHQAAAPFALSHGGVLYGGDGNRLETILDTDLSTDYFAVPGVEFFGAVSAEVQGVVDLDPALSRATRISDLRGTTGTGVVLGRIVVATATAQVELDLSGAATVGDVIDRLNAGLPADVRAVLGTRGIDLVQSGPRSVQLTVSDAGGGRAARDLGLSGTYTVGSRPGPDLDPLLTGLTRVSDLFAGLGLDVRQTLTIRNGAQAATIDLSGCETMEDVLNRMNRPELGVWARIAADGRRLEVLSRVSGTALTVEENGGLLATTLGIRSLRGETPLSGLNQGRGVHTVDGADLRITTADGTVIEVDLSGAATIQDVLDWLSAAGGGALAVGLAVQGNGIRITDLTAGGGTLTVEAVNESPALRDLGLDVAAAGGVLTGRDVNPVEVDSPFTALLELRAGLLGDDRQTLLRAAERLERVLLDMQEVQGALASQARMMAGRAERVELETTSTRILLSDVRDVDITDAAVRFQQLQTALQANLATATQVLNLSLLDFLR